MKRLWMKSDLWISPRRSGFGASGVSAPPDDWDMRSNGDRETVTAVLDRYEAAATAAAELGFDGLTTPELLSVLERLERIGRRHPAMGHDVINRLDQFAPSQELGGTLAHALADRLRISRAEARRRIGEAEDLGARTTLAGQVLAPRLAVTATAQRAGRIGAEQVRLIRGFLAQLPGWVDASTRIGPGGAGS